MDETPAKPSALEWQDEGFTVETETRARRKGKAAPRQRVRGRNRAIFVGAALLALAVLGGGLVILFNRGGDELIVRDNFSRPDSNAGLGRIESRSWKNLRGEWGVKDSAAHALVVPDERSGALVVLDVGEGDRRVSARISPADAVAGIAFRVVDQRNYWAFVAAPSYATWDVLKVVDGRVTNLGNAGLSSTAGSHVISARLTGDEVQVLVDGQALLPLIDGDLRDGSGAGLVTFVNGTVASWTSFSVASRG